MRPQQRRNWQNIVPTKQSACCYLTHDTTLWLQRIGNLWLSKTFPGYRANQDWQTSFRALESTSKQDGQILWFTPWPVFQCCSISGGDACFGISVLANGSYICYQFLNTLICLLMYCCLFFYFRIYKNVLRALWPESLKRNKSIFCIQRCSLSACKISLVHHYIPTCILKCTLL